MYLLKLALRPWRAAPLSQLFSSFAVGILLLLSGFLFWMHQGLRTVLYRMHGEQVITAYLDPSVSVQDESQIIDTIEVSLGAHPQIEAQPQSKGEGQARSPSGVQVKVVSESEFIRHLETQYPELSRELEELGPEAHQIIPRYISITGLLPKAALEKIKSITGIESVESSKDRFSPIAGAFSTLRWIAKVLMLGVVVALFTGLIQLSKMNGYLHRDSLNLLKYWGANQWTLMSPGMISGLSVGLLGGVLASSCWMTLGTGFIRHVRSLSTFLQTMPEGYGKIAFLLLCSGGGLGLIAGILGSLSAVHLSQPDQKGA